MRSLVLQTVSLTVLPVITLFAVYLLLRGHNAPGGGFIAGLVTASETALIALAFGSDIARERLRRYLVPAFAVGLLIAFLAGMIGMIAGQPFLTHFDYYLAVPGAGDVHLSTTLIFDVGVYLLVVSATALTLSVFSERVT